MDTIYFYEEMDSHLFQVVKNNGEVIDKVDIITAEGMDYRLGRDGFNVQWVDRSPSKERKYVRKIMSEFKETHIISNCGVKPLRVGV